MLFSVIVPIYNIEQFLPKCIDSILMQSYTDFELILVDDGSTDNSGKICDDYALKDDRIKIIHKENSGVVDTRREGTKISLGKYIVAIDGDDWVDIDYLKKFKEDIDKTNADIICCGISFATDGRKYAPFPYNFKEGFYNRESIKKNIFPVLIKNINGKYFPPNLCAKAIRKSLYGPIEKRLDNRAKIGEDMAITTSCISNANIVSVLAYSGYYYRINYLSTLRKRNKGFDWNNSSYLKSFLLKNLNQTEYDFTQQINRYFCHALFNIAVSHLRTNRPYKDIKKEIVYNFNLLENKEYLKFAKFKFFSKDFVVQQIMKYHQIWLLKLYVVFARRFIKK